MKKIALCMAMIGLGGLAACGNNSDTPEREGANKTAQRKSPFGRGTQNSISQPLSWRNHTIKKKILISKSTSLRFLNKTAYKK